MIITEENRLEVGEKIQHGTIEWIKCKRSFLYFLKNYVFIQDRSDPPATVRWKQWPYLVWLAKQILKNRLIIVGKARQLGVSWLACAYCLWFCKFYQNAKALMLSQKEKKAFDLISKCRFIDNHLPEFMRGARNPDQRGQIIFTSTGGELEALASTEDAGRSTDATVIFADEWEYHPYAEVNFGAVRPTISGGGRFIGVSTADKLVPIEESFFKQKYEQAKKGEGGFVARFLPWFIRPGRDQEWYIRETADMPSWMKAGEYPANERDMLETLKTRPFFDQTALDNLETYVTAPIRHELSDKYKGIRIYKLPIVGGRYCVATDPSDGKEDPHCTYVMDGRTGEQVAESYGWVPASEVALRHDELVRLYMDAFNTWETGPGGAGLVMSTKLDELQTPNRCPSLNTSRRPFTLDRVSGKKGWWSSNPLWECLIWELEEAVRLMQFIPHSQECIDELREFQQLEGEKPSKKRHGTDNYVDAISRVLHLRKYMPMESGTVTTWKYRQ